MKLFLSKPRGFCAGVVRAIEIVERALEKWGPPIYVRHPIVHNRHVVERLAGLGAVFVESLEEIPEGARCIYSAHGVAPAVREAARKRGLQEIDATCGLVTKVHSAVKRFAAKGYQIILIGHRNHVETMGTAGEAPDVTTIVESLDDVAKLPFTESDKLFYATQTTLSLDDVSDLVEALMARFPQIETLPSSSICYATQNRQMALRSIVESADLVIVVGDTTSSNSNRLREVAERRNVEAFLVNDAAHIKPEWLEGVEQIAMTAGASTPEEIVQACIERLRQLGVTEVEEVVFTEEDVVFQVPRELLSV
jgi:4-hydroxy-3-methylbut-2-en-1-yl diphosphate reductase